MTAPLNLNPWYALQVRARWERCTATALSGKGYRILLPTYQARSLRRIATRAMPLFPGYVFCQFDVNNRLPILVTAGVIAIVGRGRVPVPVQEREIAALEAVVASGLSAEPHEYLEVGQRVRIEDHPLRGVEGILVAFKGRQRLVVSITLLRRSVTLEIDRANVRTLEPKYESRPSFCPLEPALHG